MTTKIISLMVASIILAIIILFICYAYTNHNREFNATASAIQEIWSGACRLSCRDSRYSGLSGLSGLNREPAFTEHVGASCNCMCSTCPCAVVENVLKSCQPATNVYTRLIEFISECYYDVVKTLTDLYNYLVEVMRNEAYGQRQAQMISVKQLNSEANINFTKVKDDLEKGKTRTSSIKRTKSITFRRDSDVDKFTSSTIISPSIALNVEVTEVLPAKSSEETLRMLSTCSRCTEKDMTCIGTCPRAKKK